MRSCLLLGILIPILGTGCASTRPGPVQYIDVPESYLQECQLPAKPEANAELSDAFAKAYKCGEQGNRDKQRIRELTN